MHVRNYKHKYKLVWGYTHTEGKVTESDFGDTNIFIVYIIFLYYVYSLFQRVFLGMPNIKINVAVG